MLKEGVIKVHIKTLGKGNICWNPCDCVRHVIYLPLFHWLGTILSDINMNDLQNYKSQAMVGIMRSKRKDTKELQC